MLAEHGVDTMGPAHVLVVEDEVLVRMLLADELRNAGLVVTEAANADEAWTYLTSGGQADLVFSDVRMPGSMDGLELTARVRQAYPTTKIIVTSGNLGPRSVGKDEVFLPKPYSVAKALAVTLDRLHRAA